jgi:hypothetical protein
LEATRFLNELEKVNPQSVTIKLRIKFDSAAQFGEIGFYLKHPGIGDNIVFAVRFKKPTAELNFQLPEFLVVTSGDFSAESLMVLARMAAQGKLYGTKTLSLMTIGTRKATPVVAFLLQFGCS